MTRAAGRQAARKGTPRQPVVSDEEARDIGMSPRQSPDGSPIPGKDLHVTSPQTHATEPPIQAHKPPFRGMMAHGVPAETEDYEHHDRTPMGSALPDRVTKPAEPRPVIPIPVYVVEGPEAGGRALLRAVVRRLTLPAVGSADPIQVAGQDSTMKKIRILNEDTSHAGRWAHELSNLVSLQGALIPISPAAGQRTYLEIETQDSVYAISNDSGSPIISVIIEYDARGQVVK